MPIGHNTAKLQGETQRYRASKIGTSLTKRSAHKQRMKNLDDQRKVAINKDLPCNRPKKTRFEKNQALTFDLNKGLTRDTLLGYKPLLVRNIS